MPTIRFLSMDDFVEELKKSGNLECRAELLRVSDGVFANYSIVVTALDKSKNILKFEQNLGRIYLLDKPQDMLKQLEDNLQSLFEKFKEEWQKKESLVFKAGIYEG